MKYVPNIKVNQWFLNQCNTNYIIIVAKLDTCTQIRRGQIKGVNSKFGSAKSPKYFFEVQLITYPKDLCKEK